MCIGGGGSSAPAGPTTEQLVQQDTAAADKAKAEVEKMNAEREIEKAAENAKMVSEQAAQANKDAERRTNNRTLLAGLQQEEDGVLELEDPKSQSTAKRKRATLLSAMGQ